MAQKRPVAPDTPIVSYPTPQVSDIVISVDVDSRLPGYKSLEYGALYPDQTRFPGAKLVSQTPLEGDGDRFIRRIYATDRVNQEKYNYAIKYSSGSPDHPIYTRLTLELRDTYVPLADNSPDPVIPGAYLVDEEASPAEGELNSLYLAVTRVYETLPGPWVPFSRYDDDLGPVQGRRRSVINSGQVASLTANKRVVYEARDNSTGVYLETEESWSTAVDAGGNSLFPIKYFDVYDPALGPVQEKRQLIVPNGSEQGTLENVNGVITQTSFEPYNQFLSTKITRTYSVSGPQLVGKATNDERQLVTVTTQRKASDGYTPPNPTATRTVEVSREDAETLTERVIETPEIFSAKVIGQEITDPVPAKFRGAVPITTNEENVEGTANALPSLQPGDLAKSEQQVNKFVKRIRSTFRSLLSLPKSLVQKATNNQGQLVTITETLQLGDTTEKPSATVTVESEALGDGTYVVKKSEIPSVFENKVVSKSKLDLTPEKFKASQVEETTQTNVKGTVSTVLNLDLSKGEFAKSEEQITEFVKRTSSTKRDVQTTTSLSEAVITTDGQLATRKLTLSAQNQTLSPSATLIDGSIEALGDGRSVKTEVTIPSVLAKKSVTIQRPDVVPERFRAKLASTTTASNVSISTSGVDNTQSPTLGDTELERTEQDISAFVKRVSVTKRGTSYETLNGSDYEEQYDVNIPYTESIATGAPATGKYESTPIGNSLVVNRVYDTTDIKKKLDAVYETYPTTVSLDLPRILSDFDVYYEVDTSVGEATLHPEEFYGPQNSISTTISATRSGSSSLTPIPVVKFDSIWGKNLRATTHVFFIEGPVTETKIKNKLGTNINFWPNFFPVSTSVVVRGLKLTGSVKATVARGITSGEAGLGVQQQKSDDFDKTKDFTTLTVDIPPCLTAGFVKASQPIDVKFSLSAIASLPSVGQGESMLAPAIESRRDEELDEKLSINYIIPPSVPQDVPRSGVYILDTSAQFYKYGYFIVTATTFDASQLSAGKKQET